MTTTKIQYINGLQMVAKRPGTLVDAIRSLKATGKDKPKYIKVEVDRK